MATGMERIMCRTNVAAFLPPIREAAALQSGHDFPVRQAARQSAHRAETSTSAISESVWVGTGSPSSSSASM